MGTGVGRRVGVELRRHHPARLLARHADHRLATTPTWAATSRSRSAAPPTRTSSTWLGKLSLEGTSIEFKFIDGFAPAAGFSYDFIDADGSVLIGRLTDKPVTSASAACNPASSST
jgi:hypothetical protein